MTHSSNPAIQQFSNLAFLLLYSWTANNKKNIIKWHFNIFCLKTCWIVMRKYNFGDKKSRWKVDWKFIGVSVSYLTGHFFRLEWFKKVLARLTNRQSEPTMGRKWKVFNPCCFCLRICAEDLPRNVISFYVFVIFYVYFIILYVSLVPFSTFLVYYLYFVFFCCMFHLINNFSVYVVNTEKLFLSTLLGTQLPLRNREDWMFWMNCWKRKDLKDRKIGRLLKKKWMKRVEFYLTLWRCASRMLQYSNYFVY